MNLIDLFGPIQYATYTMNRKANYRAVLVDLVTFFIDEDGDAVHEIPVGGFPFEVDDNDKPLEFFTLKDNNWIKVKPENYEFL